MDATSKLRWVDSNYVRIPTRLSIHDLRDKENNLNLDINGFQLHKYLGNIHNPFEEQQSLL